MMGAAVFGRRRPFRVHAEVEKGDALLLVKNEETGALLRVNRTSKPFWI